MNLYFTNHISKVKTFVLYLYDKNKNLKKILPALLIVGEIRGSASKTCEPPRIASSSLKNLIVAILRLP